MKDELPDRTVPDEYDFCSASMLHDALNEKLDPKTTNLLFEHLGTCPVCKQWVQYFLVSENDQFRKELFGNGYDGYDRVNLFEADCQPAERVAAKVIRWLDMEFDKPGSS